MGLFLGLPKWTGTRKVKPVWILLKQETVSGSSISWAICKSAPHSRQITTPAPHRLSFLQAGCPSCRPTNSVKALKDGNIYCAWKQCHAVKTVQQQCNSMQTVPQIAAVICNNVQVLTFSHHLNLLLNDLKVITWKKATSSQTNLMNENTNNDSRNKLCAHKILHNKPICHGQLVIIHLTRSLQISDAQFNLVQSAWDVC